MATGAVVAASAAARRTRRTGAVLDTFRLAGATAPERARPLARLGLEHGPEIVALARQRVVVQVLETEAWYLDEAAYIAQRDVRPRRATRLLLTFVGIALAIVGIGMIALIRTRPVVPGPATPPAATTTTAPTTTTP